MGRLCGHPNDVTVRDSVSVALPSRAVMSKDEERGTDVVDVEDLLLEAEKFVKVCRCALGRRGRWWLMRSAGKVQGPRPIA